MKVIICNNKIEEKIFREIRESINSSKMNCKEFNVLLTGGNSIKKLYNYWSKMKLINNDKINYFYGDERCVSYLNKLSNYRMTKLTLFRGLDIKKLKINRIRGESKDLSKEIRRYSEILPSQVDLTLLSMGSDAHIASIFPNSTSVIEYNKKIILTKDSTGIKRITITPRIINSSKKIILICKGKEKGKILFNALKNKNDKSKYPVLLARNAICFIDKHASIPFVK